MTSKKPRYRTAHESTILKLHQVLEHENPDDVIRANSRFKREKHAVPGINIFPDVINFSKQIAYEATGQGTQGRHF